MINAMKPLCQRLLSCRIWRNRLLAMRKALLQDRWMGQNRQSGLRCDRGYARGLCPGLECHSLSNLIKVYGIDGANSHDALDGIATIWYNTITSDKDQ